jgi:hypothetical protein
MFMVALPAFIVEENEPLTGTPIEKGIFEPVRRWRDRINDSPHSYDQERSVVEDVANIENLLRLWHADLYMSCHDIGPEVKAVPSPAS